jgi:hypothetical protein
MVVRLLKFTPIANRRAGWQRWQPAPHATTKYQKLRHINGTLERFSNMRLIRGLFILFLGMSSTASCFSRAGLPKQEIAFGAMVH